MCAVKYKSGKGGRGQDGYRPPAFDIGPPHHPLAKSAFSQQSFFFSYDFIPHVLTKPFINFVINSIQLK